MVNYHTKLVNTLKEIKPTYYELTLDSKSKIPCISYIEHNNYINTKGDTKRYSYVSYQVKVWGNDIEEIQQIAAQIDNALTAEGWERTSSGEIYDRNSTMIQKVMIYEAMFIEK